MQQHLALSLFALKLAKTFFCRSMVVSQMFLPKPSTILRHGPHAMYWSSVPVDNELDPAGKWVNLTWWLSCVLMCGRVESYLPTLNLATKTRCRNDSERSPVWGKTLAYIHTYIRRSHRRVGRRIGELRIMGATHDLDRRAETRRSPSSHPECSGISS
ncbi:hypothetical protein GGR51DRAFT_360285 [Nemania sp. FL0031]|nr:hypothetical protein GGR51DRAFT_360285 [Nemania sp. FL0031]